MCGRYTLTQNDPQLIADRFGVAGVPGGLERFNVAPTEEALAVVIGKTGEREAHTMRWGLVPSYAKDLKAGPPMFNARSETVASKAPFKSLIGEQRHRCLIVADGFYEWLRPEDKKAPRVPFRFTVDDGSAFAFAGLWCWSRPGGGEWLASATVLTCPPNDVVARLHDRMPVILPGPEAEDAWLSASLSVAEASSLCVPLDAERMRVAPANPRVNKSGLEVEGPDLLVAAA